MVIFNGDLATARLLVSGTGPGAFATDYEFVVTVNGFDVAVQAFDASDAAFSVDVAIAGAVSAADVIAFKIRVPAGSPSPGARTPNWVTVSAIITVEDGLWSFGDVVPAGTYYITIPL